MILFKVHFEKAYDSIDWNFLIYVMEKIGFHPKWIKWIKECLYSSTVSVFVNGSPTKEFKMRHRLRKGGPLSPFLFLIIIEGFSLLMKKASELGMYLGYEFECGL